MSHDQLMTLWDEHCEHEAYLAYDGDECPDEVAYLEYAPDWETEYYERRFYP